MSVFSSNNQCSHEENCYRPELVYALYDWEQLWSWREGRSRWFSCSLQWGKTRVSESAWHSDLRALSPEVLIKWWGTWTWQPFPPGLLGQAKPELTSKVGTPKLHYSKANKGFNYLCDRRRSRHLYLIKVWVTLESGVLQHCMLMLCSLTAPNFYHMV